MTSTSPIGVKTRILIISDTHGLVPSPEDESQLQYYSDSSSTPSITFVSAFRHPLPQADVAIHCGDLTKGSGLSEYSDTFSLLASLPAPLKIAIPGNHDMALDTGFWESRYLAWEPEGERKERRKGYPAIVRGMVAEARLRGVQVLTEEGTYDFVLGNGARLRVYASPWTPEYGGWAFQYRVGHEYLIEEGTDVVVTHGPPKGVLDRALFGVRAGDRHLYDAVERVRPKVHCFGHIHEAWGAMVRRWEEAGGGGDVLVDDLSTLQGTDTDSLRKVEWKAARRNEWAEKRARRVDMCPHRVDDGSDAASRLPRSFQPGKDTLFVNAAIVDISYQPRNIPWLIDLELPLADERDVARATETAARIERDAKEAEILAASVAGGPAPAER